MGKFQNLTMEQQIVIRDQESAAEFERNKKLQKDEARESLKKAKLD